MNVRESYSHALEQGTLTIPIYRKDKHETGSGVARRQGLAKFQSIFCWYLNFYVIDDDDDDD